MGTSPGLTSVSGEAQAFCPPWCKVQGGHLLHRISAVTFLGRMVGGDGQRARPASAASQVSAPNHPYAAGAHFGVAGSDPPHSQTSVCLLNMQHRDSLGESGLSASDRFIFVKCIFKN